MITTFQVRGWNPAPQGSKTYMGHGVMVESCKQVKYWRSVVTGEALKACKQMLLGQVHLDIEFVFSRPKSHYGSGRNAAKLKESAPVLHSNKPDLSKLIRSTEDALTNIAYKDDSQVCKISSLKRYADQGELPGAIITIRPFDLKHVNKTVLSALTGQVYS